MLMDSAKSARSSTSIVTSSSSMDPGASLESLAVWAAPERAFRAPRLVPVGILVLLAFEFRIAIVAVDKGALNSGPSGHRGGAEKSGLVIFYPLLGATAWHAEQIVVRGLELARLAHRAGLLALALDDVHRGHAPGISKV